MILRRGCGGGGGRSGYYVVMLKPCSRAHIRYLTHCGPAPDFFQSHCPGGSLLLTIAFIPSVYSYSIGSNSEEALSPHQLQAPPTSTVRWITRKISYDPLSPQQGLISGPPTIGLAELRIPVNEIQHTLL